MVLNKNSTNFLVPAYKRDVFFLHFDVVLLNFNCNVLGLGFPFDRNKVFEDVIRKIMSR